MAAVLLVAAACSQGAPSQTAAKDRLIVVADGIALDPRTGLEWTSRDHDQALAWDPADRHCRGLSLGGRAAWRLPEIGDLQALYDTRFAEPCGDRTCHIDPAIHLAGPYVWSASTRGARSRFYFDASSSTSLSPSIAPSLVRRVLCVRRAAP